MEKNKYMLKAYVDEDTYDYYKKMSDYFNLSISKLIYTSLVSPYVYEQMRKEYKMRRSIKY